MTAWAPARAPNLRGRLTFFSLRLVHRLRLVRVRHTADPVLCKDAETRESWSTKGQGKVRLHAQCHDRAEDHRDARNTAVAHHERALYGDIADDVSIMAVVELRRLREVGYQ